MRTVPGGLLLIAASICLGAAVIADSLPHQAGVRSQAIAYMASMILGTWGLFLLVVGLALDRPGESRPTPAWVWITLLILFIGALAVVGVVAFIPRTW